jgi:uncharacterized protein YjbI with pentapeptide repeats
VRTDLSRVDFEDCRLALSSFAGATGRDFLKFETCNLHSTDLDFMECDAGTPEFKDCNMWGVRVALGCQVFNGKLDLRTAQQFAAMINRMHPDERLEGFADKQVLVVERLMGGRDGE